MSKQSMVLPFVNLQKQRRGLARLWHAALHSVSGLRYGWLESAFRLEVGLSVVLVPAAFWIGSRWSDTALLLFGLALVMVTELLNTGLESVVDRIGPEWHELSKKAKDIGSAATLMALAICGIVWGMAVHARWFS